MQEIMNLTVLGKNGVSRIDEAARTILLRTGVEIPHREMLGLFADAGAKVDRTSNRVRIPFELVDECLKSSGKKFTIYGRDRSRKASFGTGERNYNSIAGEAHWIDSRGLRRFATLDDVEHAAKLGDVLPRLNIVGAMADPHETDISCRCVEVAAQLLRTTTKPVTFWFFDRPSAALLIELFTVLAAFKRKSRTVSPGISLSRADQPAAFSERMVLIFCLRPAKSRFRFP